ncbi:VirK/YbjX family protein [Serratia marcescens]|uniref:VirK/YbjX family protein n=1 Tax=Serratia marcescens TaxID=615 RepID=UPI0038926069
MKKNIIYELLSGQVVPGPAWRKKSFRAKFLLRLILYYSPTKKALSILTQQSDLKSILYHQNTFPCKTHRQYLTRNLNAKQRASAIVSHYRYVSSLKSKALSNALISREETILAEFPGREESHFTISASCAHKAEREGESTLWLRGNNKELLASVTFSVVSEGAEWNLIIGGLQGPGRHIPHEAIKDATRALSGIFPKRVLMEFISHFANFTEVRAIYGVSDNGHVFRSMRYRLSKGQHLHASYDDFWSLIGGIKQSSWRWQLPLAFERKSLEHIPSKKRAEYRRRFQIIDDIAEQVRTLNTANICAKNA